MIIELFMGNCIMLRHLKRGLRGFFVWESKNVTVKCSANLRRNDLNALAVLRRTGRRGLEGLKIDLHKGLLLNNYRLPFERSLTLHLCNTAKHLIHNQTYLLMFLSGYI